MSLSYQDKLDIFGPDIYNMDEMWQDHDVFLRIPAVPSITQPAFKAAKEMGALKGSITEGRGNLAGKILEYTVHRIFNCHWADRYDYDFIMPKGWLKSHPQYYGRCDAKAKERTEDNFPSNWEVSVSDRAGLGIGQKTDFYLLGSVSFNVNIRKPYGLPTYVWLLGLLSKDEYLFGSDPDLQDPNEVDVRGRSVIRFGKRKNGAEFREKGQPYDFNGYVCSEDCWNRKASDLDRFKLTDLNNPHSLREFKKIITEAREYTIWPEPFKVLVGQKIFVPKEI